MRYFYPVFIACLALILACSIGDIAGSKGGSETTNGVIASVLNTDGTPAVGSTVRLRQADYVSQPALVKMALNSTDLVTDSQGRFIITDMDPGEYYIEVFDSTEGAVLFTFTVNASDTIDLGVDSLRPFATLTGYVDTVGTGSTQMFAQVRGLERLAEVNTNGTFTFDDLPEGFIDVVIIESGATGLQKEVLNVKTTPGDTVAVTVLGDYTYSGYIYLNAAADIPSATVLTNFPLLIRLNSSVFDFKLADPQGDDIHFVKMNNASLFHEIEQWDPVSENATLWVRVDSIYSNDVNQYIIMKWGRTDVINQSNGVAVFDTAAGFAGVWHFNEDPSSGTGAIKDRTVNGYNGTAGSSMTAENVTAGVIGNGLMFNGTTDSINAGVLNLSGNYTLSCWVKAAQSQWPNWRLIIKEGSYTLWYDTKWGSIRSEHYRNYWSGLYQDTPDSSRHPLPLDTWYYIASTFDGDKIRLYVNGEIVDSTLSIGENSYSTENPLLFGGRIYEGSFSEFFKGVMDEVRIENTARPAEWIRLCYASQRPDGNILIFKKP